MNELTPEEVAEQIQAQNGSAEERAAAISVLASAISEAIALGPARLTIKPDSALLRAQSSVGDIHAAG